MARFAQLVADEATDLRRLKASGVLLEAWSPGRPGAILVLATDDVEAARTVIDQLPLARAGLLTTTLTPLADIAL
jgi:muconolactone delta-isomerase